MVSPRFFPCVLLAFLQCLILANAQGIGCGPSTLTIQAGHATSWRINSTIGATVYKPVDLGDTNIATITSSREFTAAGNADFTITALTPGTTRIFYHWFNPNSGEEGVCSVEVTVVHPTLPQNYPLAVAARILAGQTIKGDLIVSREHETEHGSAPPGVTVRDSGDWLFLDREPGVASLRATIAPTNNPTQTTPASVTALVSPKESFRLDASYAHGKVELHLSSGASGPVTIERSEDLQTWIPWRMYSDIPGDTMFVEVGGPARSAFRARQGSPPLELGSQPVTFKYKASLEYDPLAVQYFAALQLSGQEVEMGQIDTLTGPMKLVIDPAELPATGEIKFYARDLTHVTPILSQPFIKTSQPGPNLPPVIERLPASITAANNSRATSIPIVIADDRTFPNTLDIQLKSGNTTLMPDGHLGIAVDGDGSATLSVAPFFNAIGSIPVTMTVSDGVNVTTKQFEVIATDSTPPTMTPIGNYSFVVNSSSPRIVTEVGDAQTAVADLTLTALSLNTNVVPQDGISITASSSARFIAITPAPGAVGASTIALTLRDSHRLTTEQRFNITVTPKQTFHSDFNRDGRDDIIFQDDTGALKAWLMNGSLRVSEAPLNPPQTGDAQWRIVGAGHFDADNQPDLLYQNETGRLLAWFMDELKMRSGDFVTPSLPSTGYRAVATADFNRDSKTDILFQSTDEGFLSVWYMVGINRLFSPRIVGGGGNPEEKAVGAADFNLDNNIDLLMQQPTGDLTIKYLTGAFHNVDSEATIQTTPAPDQTVTSVGDFDGDGKPDILLQQPNSALTIWFMNNAEILRSEIVTPTPGASFHAVAP